MKYYNPLDMHSSPFEPNMGNIVIYQAAKRGGASETSPAIITQTLADDRVNLTVFTSTGVYHVMRVRFSNDPTEENTWHWMPEMAKREIAPSPAVVPVDIPSPVAQTG